MRRRVNARTSTAQEPTSVRLTWPLSGGGTHDHAGTTQSYWHHASRAALYPQPVRSNALLDVHP